ncbi:MAG TPA: NAD(P)/FAD-dependent oxidoreductase [Methanolinea sp.]|nr:NAD(P)/FAD-dependent oxidoreductase [Methanolinea sp.]HQK56557.1 NAD(P)/FAD-dependent oxidoreductase [Methanolinea sp.]
MQIEGELKQYDMVVAGGGPSGLFCAHCGAMAGKAVLVLEKMPSCGRKLLVSGTGQCNITHDGEISAFLAHYGTHGKFVKPALLQFSNHDLVRFFHARGLEMVTEPGGKVFPSTRRAGDVLAVLISECARSGVDIHCNEPVIGVAVSRGGFEVKTIRTAYISPHFVIATGGVTYPATGSSGDGYTLAASLGHRITEIGPALSAVRVKDFPYPDLAGMSFEDLRISVVRQKKHVWRNRGDLIFTHHGLSGPGILDLSRYIRAGDQILVSFAPSQEPEEAAKALHAALLRGGRVQVATVLRGIGLPDRLARRLLDMAGIADGSTCAHLGRSARNAVVQLISGHPFEVEALAGFDRAMVTRGGVDLDEVNPKTMESRLHRGLYFTGEVLDVDGDSGGYNLQFACASGVLAARSIAGVATKKRTSTP